MKNPWIHKNGTSRMDKRASQFKSCKKASGARKSGSTRKKKK